MLQERDYQFHGLEKVQYNRLPELQKAAYILFATEYRAQPRHQSVKWNAIWKAWKALGEVEKHELIRRIYSARDDQSDNGEQERDEYEEEEEEEGLITVSTQCSDKIPSEKTHAEDIKGGDRALTQISDDLEWKFIWTLYNRDLPQAKMHELASTSNRLYVGFDADGIAQDRIVVKHAQWYGQDIRNIYAMRYQWVQELPDSSSILKFRYWANTQDPPRCGIRSYMDYCPSGSLEKVIESYGPEELSKDADDQIPESFIWLVFRSLAESLYVMNTGIVYDKHAEVDDKKADWQFIHHRDIKPENVFLDLPLPPYKSYPWPKLADFDLAIRPELHNDKGLGTNTYIAPESLIKEKNIDLSGKTDIWNIGVVIWSMMYSYLGAKKLRDLRAFGAAHRFQDNDGVSLDMEVGLTGPTYSSRLFCLVSRCLQIHPLDRPSPFELRKEVDDQIRKMENVLGTFKGEVPERFQLRFQADRFPLKRKYNLKRGREEDEGRSEERHGVNQATKVAASHASAPSPKRRKSLEAENEQKENRVPVVSQGFFSHESWANESMTKINEEMENYVTITGKLPPQNIRKYIKRKKQGGL